MRVIPLASHAPKDCPAEPLKSRVLLQRVRSFCESKSYSRKRNVGDTISYLGEDYKITHKSANLDVKWASGELCKNFDNTENTDMLAWLL